MPVSEGRSRPAVLAGSPRSVSAWAPPLLGEGAPRPRPSAAPSAPSCSAPGLAPLLLVRCTAPAPRPSVTNGRSWTQSPPATGKTGPRTPPRAEDRTRGWKLRFAKPVTTDAPAQRHVCPRCTHVLGGLSLSPPVTAVPTSAAATAGAGSSSAAGASCAPQDAEHRPWSPPRGCPQHLSQLRRPRPSPDAAHSLLQGATRPGRHPPPPPRWPPQHAQQLQHF